MADQFFGLTDVGRERQNNEDAFIACPGANDKFIIACVIDGVGGYSGGEIAAALTQEAILQRLAKPSGEFIPMLIDCFYLANDKILAEKQLVKEYHSMACVATLAVVDVINNQFYYAHIGDTRLYLLRDNSLVKISHDQSFVGFLEESGRLTEDAAMDHPKRNEINKALGFESNLIKSDDYIETGQSPFLPGDTLLLCSDGLTDVVKKADITDILNADTSLNEKCKRLVAAANHNGGKDNITVVLVKNTKEPLKHEATIPSAAALKKNTEVKIEVEQDQDTAVLHNHNAPIPVKSNSILITMLILLVIAFAGASIWQYLQNRDKQPLLHNIAPIPVIKLRNIQEIKLQQAIDSLKGHVLILADTVYKTPIIISQAITINRDSLIIKAKGNIIFQSDSCYKGAAFSLSQKSKSLALDSLSFSNFKVAVLHYNSVVLLKNVRFPGCETAVQTNLVFTGKKYVNGKLPVASFKADSLPLRNK